MALPTVSKADSIKVDELERDFIIHYPSGYKSGDRIPAVIILHGGGGRGKGMSKLTGFDNVSNDYYFAAVYPDGIEKSWNDGREITKHIKDGKLVDDVKFISCLIDTLVRKYSIDSSCIYVTGISNGGIMSFRLGCELSDKIAAIAPVAASMTELEYNGCSPSKTIPVMIIFGDEDPLVPFNGGEIMRKRGKVVPVKESVDFWVRFDGCSQEPAKTEVDSVDDETKAIRYSYTEGSNGIEVVYWLIKGGGHTWPGGIQYLPSLIVGKVSKEINASLEIWKFFDSARKGK